MAWPKLLTLVVGISTKTNTRGAACTVTAASLSNSTRELWNVTWFNELLNLACAACSLSCTSDGGVAADTPAPPPPWLTFARWGCQEQQIRFLCHCKSLVLLQLLLSIPHLSSSPLLFCFPRLCVLACLLLARVRLLFGRDLHGWWQATCLALRELVHQQAAV